MHHLESGSKNRSRLEDIKITLQLSLPIILAQLASIALGFIDTVMAGNLSSLDLAAVAIGRTVYMPVFIVVLGVILAVTPVVAQNLGAGKTEGLEHSFWQGIWVSLSLVIPCILLVRNMDFLLIAMDVQDEIVPVSIAYLRAVAWSLPAAFIYLVYRFYNDGIGISKPHMYLALLAIPLNVFFNYLFMYDGMGVDGMGAEGAGWATTVVWYLLVFAMILLSKTLKTLRNHFSFSKIVPPDRKLIGELLYIGVPNGIGFGLEISMFAAAALLIGSISVTALAGHQIALNIASITFMIPLGVSIATTSRVGYAIGEGDVDAAKQAGASGIYVSLIFMLLTGIVMILMPETLVRLYTREAETIAVAAGLLFFAAIFQLPDGLQVSAAGALRGLKDTRIPMIVNFIAYWGIGIPMGHWLGLTSGYGPEGLWTGLILGLTFAAIAHTSRFLLMIRKSRVDTD
ncbi:MAG: MATE family efflux transporter [Calditrichota bacterium]